MKRKELKEYRIWLNMKSRCYAPSQDKGYYKQDGIEVCDEWKYNFDQFLKDMGPMPGDDYSIERINVYGNYCKENCKWIPKNQQPINRRTTKFYTYNGERHCLKEWSRILGMNYDTLRARVVRRNIPFEVAIDENNFDRRVPLNGELHTVTEWCNILNLNAGNVFSRINRGWSTERALTVPFRKSR